MTYNLWKITLILLLSITIKAMALTATSDLIDPTGQINLLYTCKGKNNSPPIQWQNAPEGTQSFAVILQDPDAPTGLWFHWLLWNIPADLNALEAGTSIGTLGANSWGNTSYQGPCPPVGSGTHRYQLYIAALDSMLVLPAGSSDADLQEAMAGHVLTEVELEGTMTALSNE